MAKFCNLEGDVFVLAKRVNADGDLSYMTSSQLWGVMNFICDASDVYSDGVVGREALSVFERWLQKAPYAVGFGFF